jgi:imidazolonepropionase-like amidohydrolase
MNTITTLFLLGAGFATPVLSVHDGDDDAASAYEHPFETDAHRAPTLDTSAGALIRNVTIHDAVQPARVGDVLVRDGRIAEVGESIDPGGATVIDGTGKHLAPGVIDTHSHMAIERGINEGSLSITADCDISDSINSDDLGIYRALAGGVTTIQCLHGSANAIGGRSEVLKLKWGRTADELRFPDAPQGIKFALGENPKRSNWGDGGRYPATRAGVESIFQRGFRRAQEYRREWDEYKAAGSSGADPAPPRRDVRLEVLVGILEGEVNVHSHCYRADEILMLLRTAESFDIRIATLQHVLEGYKVAHEIATHGAGTSTFSDWWAYKQEAYDAIPHNAALLDEAGAVSTINSDSGELVRHLYHEAAKSVGYAGLDRVRALALATRNGAIQLGLDDRVGTIEQGKDADIVLLDGDPLSVYSRVLWTMVDGRIEFERRDAFGFDEMPGEVREIETAPVIEASYARDNGQVVAIVGGTLHPVMSPDIENGTLLIQGDRIVDMGSGIAVPAEAVIIDAEGKHVWPGMIALSTSIGLTEIGSVKGTQDASEIGGNQPDIRVASSIHAATAHIPVTRSKGITRSQTVPGGRGPIQGQSAVIRLTGDTWEETLMVDRDMLHVRFPRVKNASDKKEAEEPESVEEMRELLDESREYARLVEESEAEGLTPPPFDPRLEALAPFALGEKRIGLHASSAQSILFALKFAQEEELDIVLYGATEGWKIPDAIAAAGVPVVVGPILTVPRSDYDPYEAGYANAAVLHRAGVRVAIMANDSDNTRNTPFHAGFAAAYGLPRDEALRAITYYPAEILGVEADLGSLASGKIADVVVSDGDLLEATTQVTHVLIDGKIQDIGNKQTKLYEYYRERLHTLQSR